MFKIVFSFLKQSMPVWASSILLVLVMKKMMSTIRPEETGKILLSMDAGWLAWAIVLTLLTYLLNSYRLAIIARWILGHAPSWRKALKITWLGSFFSLAAPLAAIGDVARAGLVKTQMKSSLSHSAQIILFDRGFSIYSLILFSLVASCGLGVTLKYPEVIHIQIIVSIILLVLPVVLLLMHFLIPWPQNRLTQFIGSTMDCLIHLVKHPVCLIQQLLISLFNIFIYSGTLWAFSKALHFSFDLKNLLLFAPIVLIVNNLPFFYQGWGGREAMFLMLAPILAKDTSVEVVVTASVAYGAVTMLAALPGGLYIPVIFRSRQ